MDKKSSVIFGEAQNIVEETRKPSLIKRMMKPEKKQKLTKGKHNQNNKNFANNKNTLEK